MFVVFGLHYHYWDMAVAAAKHWAKEQLTGICPMWENSVIVGIVTDDANGLTVRDFRDKQK